MMMSHVCSTCGTITNRSEMNPNNDLVAAQPPSDDISALDFSRIGNVDYLCATSWDKSVRVYEVNPGGVIQKGTSLHEQPLLCTGWSQDGMAVFSGGCDNMVKMWSVQTNQSHQVAKHDAPVKALVVVPGGLVTGSWDKSLRFWDLRTEQPQAVVSLPERLYCLSVVFPLAIVGCAERKMAVFDLRNPAQPHSHFDSPLRFQTRSLACFPDMSGFAVGSIEGRVGIQHIQAVEERYSLLISGDKAHVCVVIRKNFSFRCHRDGNNIHAVNSIQFHPRLGSFSTAGADGTLNFWDKEHKQRLKAFAPYSNPISCTVFNSDGGLFAYAASYDWSKGHVGSVQQGGSAPPALYVHRCLDEEVTPRPKQ